MNVVQCKNGDWFDHDTYATCPLCGAPAAADYAPVSAKEDKGGFWGKKSKEKKPEKKPEPISFRKPVPNSTYLWNRETMSSDSITGFLVRFEIKAGQPPIVKATFDGKSLKVMNTINGSRDGGKNLSSDYFAEREIPLMPDQLNQLRACLQTINLENWKTSDTILGYLTAPPPGFCICNSASFTFANGSKFDCLEPMDRGFSILTHLLRRLYEVRQEPAPVQPIVEEPRVQYANPAEEVYPVADMPAQRPAGGDETMSAFALMADERETTISPAVYEEPQAAYEEPRVAQEVPQVAQEVPQQEVVPNTSADDEGKTMSFFGVMPQQADVPAQDDAYGLTDSTYIPGSFGEPGGVVAEPVYPGDAYPEPVYPQTEDYQPVNSQPEETAPVSVSAEPVVGWLACVAGCNFGACFSIFAGNNSIGRGKDNRIVIPGDPKISRSKHAFVVYDPEEREFFVRPSDGQGLVRLNGKCVLQPQPLSAQDTIAMGDSKFLFIPLCSKTFSWEDYMP